LSVAGQGTFQNSTNSTTALQVQNNGGLNVVSVDTVNNRLVIGNSSNDASITVAKASTTSTVTQSLTSVGGGGTWHTEASMILGTDGLPDIIFTDPASTPKALRFVKCGNLTCSSGNTNQTVDNSGNNFRYSAIALGRDGFPIISYFDNTNSDLKIAKCLDVLCSSSTQTLVDTTGNVGAYNSIAVPADGLPVVSYSDVTNHALKVYKCSVADCSSGTATQAYAVGGNGNFSSIAIGTDGLPIISFSGGTNTVVVHCSNTTCSSSTATTIDGAVSPASTATTIGSDGLPVVAYGNSNGASTVVKVVKCGNLACSSNNVTSTIANNTQTTQTTDVAIGITPDGLPLTFFQDGNLGNVYTFKCLTLACSSGTMTNIETAANVGGSASVRTTGDGLPLILYDLGSTAPRLLRCANYACSSGSGVALTGGHDWYQFRHRFSNTECQRHQYFCS
jgi:hypothetical protein